MVKFTGSLATYPARATLTWYLGMIVVGTTLLLLPICRAPEAEPISPLDAVFTATSASCVTGLIVRSTPHDYSIYGQIVILVLMQLGGIGIMTVTTLVTLQIARGGLRQRTAMAETLGIAPDADLRWVLRGVLTLIVVCEGFGFLVLAINNAFDRPLAQGLWEALFHAVSAFCNAGFSLHDDSLERYQGNVPVNLTVLALIIIGGIGFPVILELRRVRRLPRGERWQRLHLHAKLMLLGTAGLLAFGTLAILGLEWQNALSGMGYGRRLLVAMFQSTTTRTAGFNTIDIASLTDATLFVIVLLMAIGAGPGSCAGGFKVSTLMTLILLAWSRFRGSSGIALFRRSITAETAERAIATALLFAFIGAGSLALLLVVDPLRDPHHMMRGRFLDTLFESTSALGTVGLSTGTTTELSPGGRVIVIVLMLLGRLGPITVAIALSRTVAHAPIRYPSEEILIG